MNRARFPGFWLGGGAAYALFLLAWFRDDLGVRDLIRFGPAVPLAGLLLLAAVAALRRMRPGQNRLRLKSGKVWLPVAALILLALAVRIPYLLFADGLMSSDDAVPALMAKHIAEGKPPPVFYYGQLYMGSVSEHAQALFFKLFGYSISGFKFSILLFFLAFLVLQFRLIEDIFGRRLALASLLFYGLPIGFTISLSLDTTGAFPLVMLLGALQMTLTHRIVRKGRGECAPWLGFWMGIAFWGHPISVGFIVTCVLWLLTGSRFRWGRWLSIAGGFILGALPVVLMELKRGFPLVRFLLPNGGEAEPAGKGVRAVRLLSSLLALEEHPLRWIPLAFVVMGCAWICVRAWADRSHRPALIFPVFFIVFLLIYGLSGFSQRDAVRYLYPLYFCLPVLLFYPFSLPPRRWRDVSLTGAVLVLFILGNASVGFAHFRRVREAHKECGRALAGLARSGQSYWRAEYWDAYLLTALAGEKIVAASTSFQRYFPYRLQVENAGGSGNFIFPLSEIRPGGKAFRLIEWLSFLGVDHRVDSGGGWVWIYGIPGPAADRILRAPGPDFIPECAPAGFAGEGGFLTAVFHESGDGDLSGFGFHAEIPGYSSTFRRSLEHGQDIRVRLPAPETGALELRTWFDYEGLRVPGTERRWRLNVTPGPPGRRPVPLDGLGTNLEWEGRRVRVMEKTARFRIGRPASGARIRIDLISPFEFSHPYWYGFYRQSVDISLDGIHLASRDLDQGANRILIPAGSAAGTGPAVLTLRFRYHGSFPFAPLWRTSALLESIEIE